MFVVSRIINNPHELSESVAGGTDVGWRPQIHVRNVTWDIVVGVDLVAKQSRPVEE